MSTMAEQLNSNDLPQWERPVSFFVLHVEVDDDDYLDIIEQLTKLPGVHVASSKEHSYQRSWVITAYCNDYSILAQLGEWHDKTIIDSFRID